MIQGVLFDMDGLMFDTERLGQMGWHSAAAQLDINIPEELIADMRGTGIDQCRELFNQMVPGKLYDRAHDLRVEYAEAWIRQHGVPVKPGLRALLDWLHQKSIPAVLATSTQRMRAERYLKDAEVWEDFSATVYGPEVSRPKPAPDIFLAAASAIQADPSQCVVLEDSPNGLRAAKAAGCRAVVVPDLTPAPPEKDKLWDARADDLQQVIQILEKFQQETLL